MLYENVSCCCDQNKHKLDSVWSVCLLDRIHCLYDDLSDGKIIAVIDFNLFQALQDAFRTI